MNGIDVTKRLWRLKRRSWSYPEWWSLCLCVMAWFVLLGTAAGAHGVRTAPGYSHHHPSASNAMQTGQMIWWTEGWWWVVMVMAMMFPMLIGPIRRTAACSLWRRRHHAIVGFLLGYLATWLIFGLVAAVAVFQFQEHTSLQAAELAAVVFAVALVWQRTAVKRRSVLACHRTQSLAPSGWRADRDCLRYGWMIGSWCLVSCGFLMLGCMVAGHGLPAMVGVTAVGLIERSRPRPNQLLLSSIIAVVGLTCLIIRR